MIITEKEIEKITKENKIENLTSIYLNYCNIDSFALESKVFTRIEFLSLQNNNITNIDFIINLPNLWYFDVRNNPVDNFEILNIKNTFGFLGMTIDKYSEKSILQVKRLSVGILSIKIEENYKKYFLYNNPNIILFNNELIFEYEKVMKKDSNSNINSCEIFSKASSTLDKKGMIQH